MNTPTAATATATLTEDRAGDILAQLQWIISATDPRTNEGSPRWLAVVEAVDRMCARLELGLCNHLHDYFEPAVDDTIESVLAQIQAVLAGSEATPAFDELTLLQVRLDLADIKQRLTMAWSTP